MLFGGNLLDRESETGLRFMTAYLRGVRRYNLGKTERNVDVLAQRLGAPREEVERACWISIRDDGRVDLPSIAELAHGVLPASGSFVRLLLRRSGNRASSRSPWTELKRVTRKAAWALPG